MKRINIDGILIDYKRDNYGNVISYKKCCIIRRLQDVMNIRSVNVTNIVSDGKIIRRTSVKEKRIEKYNKNDTLIYLYIESSEPKVKDDEFEGVYYPCFPSGEFTNKIWDYLEPKENILIKEWNNNGNIIYQKFPNVERWWEYDEYENIIYFKNHDDYLGRFHRKSTEYEEWMRYDDKKRKIYYKYKDEKSVIERFMEYDNKDNLIKETYSDGTIVNYEYNRKNKCIHKWDNIGNDRGYIYDSKGNNISHLAVIKIKSDKLGRIYYKQYSNNFVEEFIFDDNDKIIDKFEYTIN